ncbi:hypothetical protein [Sphingomonas fennica]|uniref:Uncharacterized protein n=1 Tax=Edaphosphingomonas fennica TaxID=114404 RepID=A0A2T4HTB3_9SPHN|nr:hypothetical protein [Sphingomonas fennica]PTD18990.1 hypothetical protein CV103_14135 [Sphingomonas fennica]
MTGNHALAPPIPAAAEDADDPGRRFARLAGALALVERLAGMESPLEDRASAEDIAAGYGRATPIARRRFDALASETATFSAAGMEILLRQRTAGRGDCRAAARRLAAEIAAALAAMAALVARRGPAA